MAFHVRDAETDALVRELALKRGVGLTQAIHDAVASELKARDKETRMAKIREIQDRIAAFPDTGLKADKAFYDWLSGEEDEA